MSSAAGGGGGGAAGGEGGQHAFGERSLPAGARGFDDQLGQPAKLVAGASMISRMRAV
ncbi:hypothetical protein [Nocardia cyriacigeorgica]|uniref:hypothetical protein n=1 Tax=Nocardia cyriacigeorgica TaxID=135487 RepID=UPI002456CBBD|nr:hypothetical protein [Nocardia cyriacigeorgica]